MTDVSLLGQIELLLVRISFALRFLYILLKVADIYHQIVDAAGCWSLKQVPRVAWLVDDVALDLRTDCSARLVKIFYNELA